MPELHELIQEQQVEFYNGTNKISLETFLASEINQFLYKKYPYAYMNELAEFLAQKSNEYLTVKGDALLEYLKTAECIDDMAELLTNIFLVGQESEKMIRTHLHLDYQKIKFKAPDFTMADMFYQSNMAKWMPQLNVFEKCWNISLLTSMLAAEYPGYEWPQRPKQFEDCLAQNAQWFLLGSLNQLKRYKEHAKKYPECHAEIEKNLAGFFNLPN